MGRKKGIPGLSFSWKRASGLTALKQKIARETGVPLTRQGRRRKVGKTMGCCVPLFLMAGSSLAIVYCATRLAVQA